MYLERKQGWIECIVGPMFAGKSEELLRRINRYQYANKEVVVLKPTIDDRYSKDEVVSHNKNRVKAIGVKTARDIMRNEPKNRGVIAIDEIQFVKDSDEITVLEALQFLADIGHIVIVSGLDQTFQGETFGFMGDLVIAAEYVTKLSAVCVKCGAPATKSQRLVNGKPAKYDDPIVMVGAEESYEARCRHCFEIDIDGFYGNISDKE